MTEDIVDIEYLNPKCSCGKPATCYEQKTLFNLADDEVSDLDKQKYLCDDCAAKNGWAIKCEEKAYWEETEKINQLLANTQLSNEAIHRFLKNWMNVNPSKTGRLRKSCHHPESFNKDWKCDCPVECDYCGYLK